MGGKAEERDKREGKDKRRKNKERVGTFADHGIFFLFVSSDGQCLALWGSSPCFDSGRNLSDHICVGIGETLPTLDRNGRNYPDFGGIVYDEGILAEHFVVGISVGGGNGIDCVCSSQ